MTIILKRDVPNTATAQGDAFIAGLTEGMPDALGMGYPLRRYEWAIEHREWLWPDVKLDFVEHPYLEPIYKDEHPYIVVCKAGQMGLSEWAVTDAFWACDARGANVLYLLPGTGDVQDFSTTRVGLAIEASPYIAGIIAPPETAGGYLQRARDRTTLKRVRNRFLYLRHGSVRKDGRAPHLKVAAIDLLIFDEIDEMDQRAPLIAEKRLGHSALKWQRWISTPSIPEFGIHRKLLESDHREWLVKCKRCNEWQPLDPFVNLIRKMDGAGRPTKWFHKRGSPEEPRVVCRKCKKPLDRLGKGEWVARHPERTVHGYHVNKLVNPRADLLEIIRKGQTYNETERKEWYNQDLGLPYRTAGGGFDEVLLRGTIKGYRAPQAAARTAMGVDVGAMLHVVIREYFKIEVNGVEETVRRAVFIGEVDEFDDLDDLIRRYGVRKTVVDALPETRAAMAWASKHKSHRVKLVYFATGKMGTKRDDPTREKPNEEYIVELDRTRWFDEMRGMMQSGEIWNPAGLFTWAPDYPIHFQRMTRVLDVDADGNPYARWVSAGADHYVLADLYCNAALDIMGPALVGDGAVMMSGDGKGRKDTVEVEGKKAGWDLEDAEPGDTTGRRQRKSAWR